MFASKNITWSICQHLSYGDILALGQTCKENQKYIADNSFWDFLLAKKFGLRPGETSPRFKFLNLTIKNIVKPYILGDYDKLNRYIKKYNNVWTVKVVPDKSPTRAFGYGHQYNHYFVIRCNDENQILYRNATGLNVSFLYDARYDDLVLLDSSDNGMSMINTKECNFTKEAKLTTSVDLFHIPDLLNDQANWIRKGNVWLYSTSQYRIELDMRLDFLLVETIYMGVSLGVLRLKH